MRTPTSENFSCSFPNEEEDDLSFEQLDLPRDKVYRLKEREIPCGPYLDPLGLKRWLGLISISSFLTFSVTVGINSCAPCRSFSHD